MLKTIIDWTAERARKGVEFEIEGAMFKAAAEYVPHACASAIGCALAKAQIGLVIIIVAVGCTVIIVRHNKGNRNAAQQQEARQSKQDTDC